MGVRRPSVDTAAGLNWNAATPIGAIDGEELREELDRVIRIVDFATYFQTLVDLRCFTVEGKNGNALIGPGTRQYFAGVPRRCGMIRAAPYGRPSNVSLCFSRPSTLQRT